MVFAPSEPIDIAHISPSLCIEIVRPPPRPYRRAVRPSRYIIDLTCSSGALCRVTRAGRKTRACDNGTVTVTVRIENHPSPPPQNKITVFKLSELRPETFLIVYPIRVQIFFIIYDFRILQQLLPIYANRFVRISNNVFFRAVQTSTGS